MWALRDHESNTAVITQDGESISYGALSDAVDAFAEHLPGRCLVYCLCTNDFGSLVGYVACQQNQAVCILGEASLNAQAIANLTAAYRPEFIWCPDSVVKNLQDVSAVYSAHGYSLLKTTGGESFPLAPELGLLLTTSGSTGSPKHVRISYRNLQANTESIVQYLGIKPADRCITTLPMSYTYGLSVINSHLSAGASIVLTDWTLMQREFWELLEAQDVTSISGVPYTYQMLARLGFFKKELPSVRTLTQAGGRLAPEMQKKFAEFAQERGIEFVVMYGQTEATARISYLPSSESLNRCGSVGIPIPGGKMYLVDEEGKTIESTDTIGELVYEGDNVTLGYAESGADLAKGDERNGVLCTGDLARFDKAGYFYIAGRTKRFLKLFGKRVNLDEVEAFLRRDYPDLDIACGGQDDKLCVFVASNDELPNLKAYLAEKLGVHFIGLQIQLVESIPRNSSGKTLYNALTS